MSAEIPLDADRSHPKQAPEIRVRASNLSHTLGERQSGYESKDSETEKENPDGMNFKRNQGFYLGRKDEITSFKALFNRLEDMNKYTK